MKQVRVNLSRESIESARKELESYKTEIRGVVNALVAQLVDDGVAIAKAHIVTMGAVESTELLAGIEGAFDSVLGIGYVKSSSNHTWFVEFGTGIVGEQNEGLAPPYITGYVQNASGHDESGWYYYDEKQGRRRWTRGMPPRPFMYKTLLDLQERARSMTEGMKR